MRARFIGNPLLNGEGPQSLSLFGVSFAKGEWVRVSADVRARLAINNHFEIDADNDGEPEMSVEEIKARLDELGVKYHHKAGLAKLTELLKGAEDDASGGDPAGALESEDH